MEFIVVSGLSGAGKSQAASILEDVGYFVVDNMPASLIPRFAELAMAGQVQCDKTAIVTDIRAGQSFDGLFAALDELKKMGCAYRMLFMEASVETIVKRYKETRHLHPLARETQSLEEAIRREKLILEPVRARAAYIVDTSSLSTAKLRGELLRLFDADSPKDALRITVTSFGFKYGIPLEADLVFDVRFLPNPYWVPELRHHTGMEKPVYDFVFSNQQGEIFMNHLEQMMGFLLPQYVAEGKAALVIAVGCTGGRHRSVAVARALTDFIRRKGFDVSENHRDMTREA